MQIRKETEVMTSGVPSEVQLGAINALAKVELTAEQVYVFSLRLCDDQVDRDLERFDTAALPELATRLAEELAPNDLLLVMGAGDIDGIFREFSKKDFTL